MSAPTELTIHSKVETFYYKPEMSTSWWHEKKSQRIAKVIRIYLPRNMNVCTKFLPIH